MRKDSKLFAFLGVFLTVIGFIIVYATQKKDRYAMFYAKQGLVLFIAWVIAGVIGWIFTLIPFLRWIGWVLEVILVVAWVIGMIYALSDEQKEIPIIGTYAKMIKV
jgi:uncharacterized membrane protein